MKVVIQLSVREEERALPILLRHSPGTILPDRVYVIGEEAARALREADIHFSLEGPENVNTARQSPPPSNP
jgi:hypothetical protein